jgi:hypothetical protein
VQLDHVFSVAQIFGYLAFIMGVASFLQKNDIRFKSFMAAECVSYVIHFWMLGNYTAVASSAVSVGRSLAAIKTRSVYVALGFVALSLALGAWLATTWLSLLPIIASCIGTLSLFLLQGVRMRCVMLVGTSLWLLNNILSGSIGGTMLEATVLATNLLTIRRMLNDKARTSV